MKYLNPFEYKSMMLQIHLDECKECNRGKQFGHYCSDGNQLRDELDSMICLVELKQRVAA